ncbi:MAG: recombinase family protein [Planctomycetes bacterium]|nr:recombinase family protein [Planctomycetota bacterium]
MARADTINAPRGGKRIAIREQCAIGYVRRSTDRQEQSIPDQKKAIEQYTDDHELRLLRFYVDDAISGTSTIKRHAFQDMIADAKKRSCDFRFVVVYDVKRFGRVDNDEAGYYRHILRSQGIEVIYTSENFNGDGTDDLIRPVKQWQAREESKDLAKVVIRGLLSKTESGGRTSSSNGTSKDSGSFTSGGGGGWWMGGAPPYGYDLAYESLMGEFLFCLRYMRDGSKQMLDSKCKLIRTLPRGESIAVSRRDRCKLIPSEEMRVKTIKRIFEMYVKERRGFMAIAKRLNKDGVLTSRGPQWASQYSGLWSQTSVRAILVNPAYCGDMVWNRRTDARFFRIADGRAVERKGVVGRRLELNNESDWIVIENAHTAIVKRRLFDTAKQRLLEKIESRMQRGINPRNGAVAGQSTQPSELDGSRAKFLLSRLCSCLHCESRYEGYSRYPSHTNSLKVKTLHYACGGYIRRGRSICTLGAIHKDQLEEAVINATGKFYKPFTKVNGESLILKAIRKQLGSLQKDAAKRRIKYEAEIEKIDEHIKNLLDNINASNRDIANRRLDEITLERNSIESQLTSLNLLVMEEAEIKELVQETILYTTSLDSILHHGLFDDRRSAIRHCVKNIFIDRDHSQAIIALRILPTFVGGQAIEKTIDVIVPITIGK